MPAHLISEDTTHDLVVEYAAILDHGASQDTEKFADKFASFQVEQQEEDDEIEYTEELYQYIANETATQLAQGRIPDKDLEAIVNLVVYILLQSPQPETLIQTWFTKLTEAYQLGDSVYKNKKKTLKVLSLISNLSSTYNVNVSGELNRWILSQILSLVRILEDARILKPFVENAETVVAGDDEESRSLLVSASEMYYSVDQVGSLKLLQLAAKVSPPSAQIAEQYIIKSLNSTQALDLQHITSDATITSVAPKELVQLVEQYHTQEASEFAGVVTSAASAFSQLDTKTITHKNKLFTLLSLAQKEAVIPYATIKTQLALSTDAEVELIIIDAIKRGILEGKLSQVSQTFNVYGVKLIVKKVTKEDWSVIKQKLLEHKKALGEVKQLVQSVQKKKGKN